MNYLAFNTQVHFRSAFFRSALSSSLPSSSPRSHQRRHIVQISASARPPPKPGFYKNPSRAIEKGGGFYVPGLQGPRLRFFVPLIASVFLALNHASASTATMGMVRSETLAVLAALGVLVTALSDTLKTQEASTDQVQMQEFQSAEIAGDGSASAPTVTQSNAVQWAVAVVKDLTTDVEIAHFRQNELMFGTPRITPSIPGAAVERVRKEQRPLYVAKSSTLPEEVTLPFLEEGEWSVFMVPSKENDVVVFASPEELSRDNRRWMEILCERIAE